MKSKSLSKIQEINIHITSKNEQKNGQLYSKKNY